MQDGIRHLEAEDYGMVVATVSIHVSQCELRLDDNCSWCKMLYTLSIIFNVKTSEPLMLGSIPRLASTSFRRRMSRLRYRAVSKYVLVAEQVQNPNPVEC